ncbi:hypothetical protein [uncultured Winogradskyella sp.]|uniref:hypothetical protein n=1 Tax=uncultured Winogradskyella sp. TaxID=395353 RepID=UPI0030D71B70|tara:strand:+ start:52025 stop:52207 length:183 start_codon:yes stop_codon:yes gene_type:complete
MKTRKKIVIVGVVLIILGMILMGLLKDNEYGHLIGGLVVGAGGGCLSVLFSPKTDKPKIL